MARVIVFDASVLIAYLDGDDAQHVIAENLLAREIDDEFAANSLTLAEVLVAPSRQGRLGGMQRALHDLDVRELPFPADSAVQLARLRAETGLKMPDCCVLLAAEAADARVASFDGRLLRAAVARGLPTLQR
jgi:predicted nucleic acid-binding protein